jgi:hypothetical protein
LRCGAKHDARFRGGYAGNGIYGNLEVSDGIGFVTDMDANDGQKIFAIYQGIADSKN